MIMALIGKSAVTVSSGMAYILAAELFPTQVRYLAVNKIMVDNYLRDVSDGAAEEKLPKSLV